MIFNFSLINEFPEEIHADKFYKDYTICSALVLSRNGIEIFIDQVAPDYNTGDNLRDRGNQYD